MFVSPGLEFLVTSFKEACQKCSKSENKEISPLEELVTKTIKTAKSRLLNQEGTPLNKAESLQELLFLQTQGINVKWADFAISEIMMTDNFSVKLMAYLAASQFWEPGGDVIMMVTQCINRDLTSSDIQKKSLALTLIPLIATSSFAESVVANVSMNFNSPNEEIRQKSITCFYKLCLKYPECLPAGIKAMNIKSLLTDASNPPGVIHSALSLLNELTLHCPATFKTLLPTLINFFQDTSGSPWILARALSIVSNVAVTLEARALDKFNQKITGLVNELLCFTSAPSVAFEVIRLICKLKINNREIIRTAAERAQQFIENEDPNLRYLGLTSIAQLMKINQNIIDLHNDILINCLESEDKTIVFIAVDLLESIVTKKNIGQIILSFVEQVEHRNPGVVRDTLVRRIIKICQYGESAEYERFTDYEWYVNVLLTVHSYGVQIKELSDELLTMALRAKITRPTLVSEMIDFMSEMNPAETDFIQAAAFIIGEYSEDDEQQKGFEVLLNERIQQTDAASQASCIQNAFKIYSKSGDAEIAKERASKLFEVLPEYSASRFTEVQERATMYMALVGIFSETQDIEALSTLYSMPMQAVDASAQGKVSIPSSLDIATPIVELDPQSSPFELDFEEDMLDSGSPTQAPLLLPKSRNMLRKKEVVVQKEEAEDDSAARRKSRRLMLKEKSRDDLLPCEGEKSLSKQRQLKKSNDPLAKVDISKPTNATLPELKPYSQNELLIQQSKSTLAKKKSAGIAVSSYEVFKQLGNTEGISMIVTQLEAHENCIHAEVEITNTSYATISTLEFDLDNQQPQCLKEELAPQQTVNYNLVYKCEPSVDPKIIKVVVIPTGGSGEMLRGKLRISPILYMKPAESSAFGEMLKVCNSKETTEIDIQGSITSTINKINSIIKGTIVKAEVDGKKIIGLVAKCIESINVVIVFYPSGKGKLTAEIMTNESKLTKLIQTEVTNFLKE